MKTWNLRPPEIRTLFNPAFCGLVLAHGIKGYNQDTKSQIPFSLTLLILPLCLHKRTREQILENKQSYLTKIIEMHPDIRVNLANRTKGLFPYTMEGFAYLMKSGLIQIDEGGGVILIKKSIVNILKGSQDTQDCQRAAILIGKKFGKVKDKVTVYTTLGIRP